MSIGIFDENTNKIKYIAGSATVAVDTELNPDSTNPVENKVITNAINEKANSEHTHEVSDILNFPTSLPADGGNADTLQYKTIDDFAEALHTHTVDEITDFPSELPASDVYAWAKASEKPIYTADEVGALSTATTHLSGDISNSEKVPQMVLRH